MKRHLKKILTELKKKNDAKNRTVKFTSKITNTEQYDVHNNTSDQRNKINRK